MVEGEWRSGSGESINRAASRGCCQEHWFGLHSTSATTTTTTTTKTYIVLLPVL